MASRRVSIPGFYYDEEKQRYFREPPKHLAYMQSDQLTKPCKKKRDTKTKCDTVSVSSNSGRCSRLGYACGTALSVVPKSVFSLASRMPSCRDPSLLQRTLPQTLVCSSKSVGGISRSVVNDMKVNIRGDLAVFGHESELVDVLQVSLVPPQRRICLLRATRTAMTARMSGISAHGTSSDVVVVFNGCYVHAQTYEKGRKGVEKNVSYDFNAHFPRNTFSRDLEGVELISCLPRFSGGVLCAVSYVKGHAGKVSILSFPDGSTLICSGMYSMGQEKILSLTFREEPLLLYVGTRSGIITAWDLRSKSKASTITVKADGSIRPSVIRLHSIDSDYLVTSCMDSRLLLWDCRMQNRQVLSYAEHRNSHHWCQSIVNESQGFVASVEEDRSILIWSTWTGRLLRRIQMSMYVSDEAAMDGVFPVICHTERLGGVEGAQALLIGTPEGVVAFT
jgi:hypothetical protein